jgi:hypothetical protein
MRLVSWKTKSFRRRTLLAGLPSQMLARRSLCVHSMQGGGKPPRIFLKV